MTGHFDTPIGRRQSCIASRTNFVLFDNDLPEVLQEGYDFEGQGVNILLCADDIVLLEPMATGLQHMINRLEGYCDTWNL